MYLLENIEFTRRTLNRLYQIGVWYKWFGPKAPLILRWIYYVLNPTPLRKKIEGI